MVLTKGYSGSDGAVTAAAEGYGGGDGGFTCSGGGGGGVWVVQAVVATAVGS